jgi:thymidylate kinase
MAREGKGKFVVVDGLDGVGKGVFLAEFVKCAKAEGKRVFDVEEFWKKEGHHPSLSGKGHLYEVIVTSEPTFTLMGKLIREELTGKTASEAGRKYSPNVEMEAFALDRRISYEQLILPVLAEGIDVYQSRSFSSSLTYQLQRLVDRGVKGTTAELISQILEISGNAFCLQHPMDYLVVPTITDVNEAMRRSQSRGKQDDSVFENLDFQLKLKPRYECNEFKKVFEKLNVPITYLDAGISIEHSQQQAKQFYSKHLR